MRQRKFFNQREREREREREIEREKERERERTSGLNLTIFVSRPVTKNLIYLVCKPARFCSDH